MTLANRQQDLLVISEPDDPMGCAVERGAARLGAHATRATPREAAKSFSIWVDGEQARVTPEVPLFLRPVAGAAPGDDSDERFLAAEGFAGLWAAAALTPRTVVNRPDEWGWAGKASLSSTITDRRAARSSFSAEAFWHRLPPDDGFRYHQNCETWTNVADPREIICGRSRRLSQMRGWEQVLVVGARTFRATSVDLGDADLESQSANAAGALGLTFATVSWGIPSDGSTPILTRINPFPTLPECRPVIASVIEALLELLLR